MVKKAIVIINGSGGVGKDTFIDLCAEEKHIENYSSVDLIKTAATTLGWNGQKTDIDRKFLSDLKTLCINYNDLPFKYLSSKIDKFLDNEQSEILFLHIREPEEINKILDVCPWATTLLVINDRQKNIVTNDSDKNVFDFTYDYVVQNNTSLENLRHVSKQFICDIFKMDKLK